ncbi:MAG: dockerin type I repeat-containing protein, partial [Oscillospiraceae bacterium]
DLKVNDIKLSSIIYGDVNSDGNFNIKDVVILKKWLLGVSDIEITNYKTADLYEDGKIDIFDLCMMKNKLLFH